MDCKKFFLNIFDLLALTYRAMQYIKVLHKKVPTFQETMV